jgi:hypothetical protein
MATGQHDTDGTSPADKTFLTRMGRVLDRVPWKSLFVLILLSLSSYISSCYTGPHAEAVSSSTISVPTPEVPTDQAIRHIVTIAADGSLSGPMQQIQRTLQAIERRLALTPPTSQSPQQPCSISVNCPADSDRDVWLTGQLQDIQGKIGKLIELRPPPVSDSEQCRIHPSLSHEVPDKFIVESTKSITDCVGLLIQRVAELDRVATEWLSAKNTSAIGDSQGRRDVEILVADNLIQRLDELSRQATHLKGTLTSSKQMPLWAIFIVLAIVVFLIVRFAIRTTCLITGFMVEHYETNGSNIFQDSAHLLAKSPEQLSEEERHYSKLRFAIFTIFMAISGALGTINLQKDYQDTTRSMHDILPIIGMFVTIVFASFEFAIDWIETEYGYMARAIWLSAISNTNKEHQSDSVSIGGATDPMNWVRCPIWAIYGFAASFWLYLLYPHQHEPDPYEALFLFGATLIVVLILVRSFWHFLTRCGECFRNRLSERLRGTPDHEGFWGELKRRMIDETAIGFLLARLLGR